MVAASILYTSDIQGHKIRCMQVADSIILYVNGVIVEQVPLAQSAAVQALAAQISVAIDAR